MGKESPSKNIDDEDYHGSGENSSSTGQETPVTDFSDSGVSENEMLQVNMNDELEGLTLILSNKNTFLFQDFTIYRDSLWLLKNIG